ncbi:hypothetical protein HZB05_01020 [Candidatus Wolfebacteria bacterium]|nr:hypothetical protein [Candidatus Wolfebacteria bacterium]
MNKTRPKERCIHCLKVRKRTDDHILPKSYYPTSVSSEVRNQWVAPACQKCNNDLGKVEDELLTLLGLCLNRRTAIVSPTSSISQKVLRSLNPKTTSDEREKRIREARTRKIVQSIFPTKGSINGIFPNFGYHAGWTPEEQYGVPIPANLPEKVGRKLIRGIEYKLDNRYINNSFDLNVYFCHEDTIRDVISLIRKNGQKETIAPGFEFYRVAFERRYFLYEIRIWDKFVVYGSMMKKPWWRLILSPWHLLSNI